MQLLHEKKKDHHHHSQEGLVLTTVVNLQPQIPDIILLAFPDTAIMIITAVTMATKWVSMACLRANCQWLGSHG
ncbi:unnamed protein product, partial [Musa acuminata var. zebrina]